MYYYLVHEDGIDIANHPVSAHEARSGAQKAARMA